MFLENTSCSCLKFLPLFQTKVTFGNIAHQITKVDCQPTLDMGIMIMVTGLLKVGTWALSQYKDVVLPVSADQYRKSY